jgi:hypothetical protein
LLPDESVNNAFLALFRQVTRFLEDPTMNRTSGLKRLVVVTFLVLGTVMANAQQPGGAPAMTAERSWAIQNVLQSIDADREAWVGNLVGKWASALDPAVYDLAHEVAPRARVAPAWQLYGALQAGDFRTMLQVLRGTRNAGPYINGAAPTTLAQPTPLVLGQADNQLVFTPIAPCRVVDTRDSGARTGAIPANTSRAFDLTADAGSEGQGGGPFPCPGLPSFHHLGWSVNITVVGVYTTYGVLKAYRFNGSEPNASVINWVPGLNGAIANGVTLMGCFGCADDIVIKAFGEATHVIIDVMGYFSEATANTSTVTYMAGALAPIAGNGTASAAGAPCPAGTILVGGGAATSSFASVFMAADSPSTFTSTTTWVTVFHNSSATAESAFVESICMDRPILLP